MKLLSFLVVFFALNASAQKPNPDYDPALAGKLGADERGMKMYVLVILKSGPANVTDSLMRAEMFAGHFKNIHSMADMGKLVVAGPLEKNDLSYRGIFILDVPTFDEAKALLQNDPTISGKIFEPVYLNWYGSAALREYIPFDGKIRKNLN